MHFAESVFCGTKRIEVSGRIDANSSPNLQKQLEQLILSGERFLAIDFSKVEYISSAGLRVLIIIGKQLDKIQGVLILYQLPQNVASVLKATGFLHMFPRAENPEQIKSILSKFGDIEDSNALEVDGVSIQYVNNQPAGCKLMSLGTQEKLANSEYSNADVVQVGAKKDLFGAGLATFGLEFDEYKNLFGEAVILDGSLFYLPAQQNSVVDFMEYDHGSSSAKYLFLNGFGFEGKPILTAGLDPAPGNMDLEKLVKSAFALSDSDLIGMVAIAESKGVLGMSLKKSPIDKNRPSNKKDIFDSENFTDWFDFPIDPTFSKNLMVLVGIAARDKTGLGKTGQSSLPQKCSFHFHGAIFPKTPMNKGPETFDDELNRITRQLTPIKVQHLSGNSRLGFTLLRIYNLSE